MQNVLSYTNRGQSPPLSSSFVLLYCADSLLYETFEKSCLEGQSGETFDKGSMAETAWSEKYKRKGVSDGKTVDGALCIRIEPIPGIKAEIRSYTYIPPLIIQRRLLT